MGVEVKISVRLKAAANVEAASVLTSLPWSHPVSDPRKRRGGGQTKKHALSYILVTKNEKGQKSNMTFIENVLITAEAWLGASVLGAFGSGIPHV